MVMEKSRSHLEALARLAPELNHATDSYTNELREIEAELKKLNLGIKVELQETIRDGNCFEENDKAGEPTGIFYHSCWLLGYDKVYDHWQLFVRQYCVHSNDERYDWTEESTFPLVSASRDLRIAAADFIPLLLERIGEVVKAKIAALKKASDKK